MFILFCVWRIVDILITVLAPTIIPYLGFFPYKELLIQYNLPDFLSHLASFDGVHYTQIADNGYAQNEQAFFPLYPLIVKGITLITRNRLVSGLIMSNLAFLIGLFVFNKYLGFIKHKNKLWVVVFLLLFPTSFFFGAVYTEGLFFFLLISSLYFLKKKNYLLAGLFAALSSATRLVGIFLIFPLLFHLLSNKLHKKYAFKIKHLFILSPFAGFLAYCIYLWKTVGDPLFFFHAQPSFGANRSTSLVFLPQVYFRYIKIFFTASWNFQYFISVVEFVFFTFVFVVLILDLLKTVKFNKNQKLKIENYDRLGLGLFSFANLLLPTLTGTFSSIPRYALFSISIFLFLNEIKNKHIKIMIGCIFFILHIVLLGFFIQGYFVG